ncbi:MAG: hypothetical protein JWR26_4538 [Pedosphaera sp.]|nr:hypothetical protein [Pedosphaera sp.]
MFFGGFAALFTIILKLFRWYARHFGLKEVLEEGAVMTEDGLDLRSGVWKRKVRYVDVESVEFFPHYLGPYASLLLLARYGNVTEWIGTRLFHPMVIIKLKSSSAYLLTTPKNGTAFVEQLKLRMEASQGRTFNA